MIGEKVSINVQWDWFGKSGDKDKAPSGVTLLTSRLNRQTASAAAAASISSSDWKSAWKRCRIVSRDVSCECTVSDLGRRTEMRNVVLSFRITGSGDTRDNTKVLLICTCAAHLVFCLAEHCMDRTMLLQTTLTFTLLTMTTDAMHRSIMYCTLLNAWHHWHGKRHSMPLPLHTCTPSAFCSMMI